MINEDSHTGQFVEKAIQKLNSGWRPSIDGFSDELIIVMFGAWLNMKNRPKTKDEMRILLGLYNEDQKCFELAKDILRH